MEQVISRSVSTQCLRFRQFSGMNVFTTGAAGASVEHGTGSCLCVPRASDFRSYEGLMSSLLGGCVG